MHILFIILVVVLVVALMSSTSREKYWSLPFAGGDVVTDYPNPHRIEGEVGHIMDEYDEAGTYPR